VTAEVDEEFFEPEPRAEAPHPDHVPSALERRAAIDARRRVTNRRRTLVWGSFVVVLAGSVVAVQVTRPGPVYAGGVPRDLDLAATELVQRWNAGAVEPLALVFHPAGLDAFRSRLEQMVENRGWTTGFPAARHVGSRIVEGTAKAPAMATTTLAIEPGGGEVLFAWQYEPLHERWYAYDVQVPPPPLAPVVERLRTAWESSSVPKLAAFFDPDRALKLRDTLQRRARSAGWGSRFPALGEEVTTGEEARQTVADRERNVPVDTLFQLPRNKLRVRWRFRPESDTWFVGAVTFPRE
jgi:hypothetical protein